MEVEKPLILLACSAKEVPGACRGVDGPQGQGGQEHTARGAEAVLSGNAGRYDGGRAPGGDGQEEASPRGSGHRSVLVAHPPGQDEGEAAHDRKQGDDRDSGHQSPGDDGGGVGGRYLGRGGDDHRNHLVGPPVVRATSGERRGRDAADGSRNAGSAGCCGEPCSWPASSRRFPSPPPHPLR